MKQKIDTCQPQKWMKILSDVPLKDSSEIDFCLPLGERCPEHMNNLKII